RIELERAIATGDRFLRLVRHLVEWRIAAATPAVRVYSNLRPAGPADQVVDRLARRFADDVPTGDLQTADGRVKIEPAACAAVVEPHRLGELLHVVRIATEEVARHPLNVPLYGLGAFPASE